VDSHGRLDTIITRRNRTGTAALLVTVLHSHSLSSFTRSLKRRQLRQMFFLASVCNHVVTANVLISWTGVHWARGGGVWGGRVGVGVLGTL